MLTNIITFRKSKIAHVRIIDWDGGHTNYRFEWRLFLDGKRIPNTYVKSKNIGEGIYLFQCRCEGVPLYEPMNEKIRIINDYFTLIDAKRALVDYFNKNYEGD